MSSTGDELEPDEETDDDDGDGDGGSSSSSHRARRAAGYSRDTASGASAGLAAGRGVSKVQARKMVLVGLLVLTIVTVYKDRKSETPAGTFRVFWGVGVVGMFLSLLADFAPQIAGPFAALIALGSLTNGGMGALEKVLGTVSPHTPAGNTSGMSNDPVHDAAGRTGSSSSSNPPPGPGSGSSSGPPTGKNPATNNG